MQSAKVHFEQNIIRVKNLGAIYASINLQTTPILDLSDILRAQYVMLVSALDHFIHELVRFGMLEIYNENRRATKEFKEFIFSTDKNILFSKAIMEEKSDIWLNHQIRHRNGFKSFQEADKIKEAMLLIIEVDIWKEVASILGEDVRQIKRRLNLIIDRRNQISHEADIEPTYQELRTIYIDDVKDSILFIESLVEVIFNFCNEV
jgi:hypothetical protein